MSNEAHGDRAERSETRELGVRVKVLWDTATIAVFMQQTKPESEKYLITVQARERSPMRSSHKENRGTNSSGLPTVRTRRPINIAPLTADTASTLEGQTKQGPYRR